MKYKHLFFDLDHTLWDFEANAKETLQELYELNDLASRNITDFEGFFDRYSWNGLVSGWKTGHERSAATVSPSFVPLDLFRHRTRSKQVPEKIIRSTWIHLYHYYPVSLYRCITHHIIL